MDSAAAAEIRAAAESTRQGRIQDLVLPIPTDTTTGALAQIGMCNSCAMLSVSTTVALQVENDGWFQI